LDIPIIKNNSYTSGASSAALPVGSGRYYLIKDGENLKLKHNVNSIYNSKGSFNISDIDIIKISDTESLIYDFNYGKIHALYVDLSDGNSRFRGNIELVSFGSNSMVFAVVNTAKPYFRSPEASQGITYIINRLNISKNILMNNIKTVWYPLNPSWDKTKNANLNSDIYSTSTGHDYFNKAGLTLSGLNRCWEDEPVELNIIVNQEDIIKVQVANSIADDLKGMGFAVTVNPLKWDDYIKAIAKGEFDIYIGEVMLPYNMDITSILNPSICNNGMEYSDEFLQAINDFNNGELDVRSFVHIFQEKLPFIPLYFSSSALAINRSVMGDFNPCETDIFNGIENWSFSNE
jgi:peptide/nickel transport system substrate-binding protein